MSDSPNPNQSVFQADFDVSVASRRLNAVVFPAGAPLKVCPQGFSCCTVEMEEKLSQQSHTEIKAPVSRLSTNLQATFRQRYDHFDSKRAYSGSTCMCYMISDGLPHLLFPRAETLCLCLRLWARPPVSHCLPAVVGLLRTAWSSATPLPSPLETRTLVDRPHTSSDLVSALLPVPLCVSDS